MKGTKQSQCRDILLEYGELGPWLEEGVDVLKSAMILVRYKTFVTNFKTRKLTLVGGKVMGVVSIFIFLVLVSDIYVDFHGHRQLPYLHGLGLLAEHNNVWHLAGDDNLRWDGAIANCMVARQVRIYFVLVCVHERHYMGEDVVVSPLERVYV